MFRYLFLFCAILVAGCATKTPPGLTAEDRAKYRIEKVSLVVPATSYVRWSRGETALLAAAGLSEAEQSVKDAHIAKRESQIELRERAQAMLLPGLKARLEGRLSGETPMLASVLIDQIATSSVGRTFLLGSQQVVVGVIQLYDLETGEAVSRPQRMFGDDSRNGGVIGAIIEASSRDPMIRLGEQFGDNSLKWMTATEPVQYLGASGEFLNRPANANPSPSEVAALAATEPKTVAPAKATSAPKHATPNPKPTNRKSVHDPSACVDTYILFPEPPPSAGC